MNAPTPTPATTQPRPAAKHTPGPWHAEGKSVISENGEMEASITTGKWQENNEESRANARLISAAPALIDVSIMASKISERIRQELIIAGFSGPSIADLLDLADAARAAIAQAEGGAQ